MFRSKIKLQKANSVVYEPCTPSSAQLKVIEHVEHLLKNLNQGDNFYTKHCDKDFKFHPPAITKGDHEDFLVTPVLCWFPSFLSGEVCLICPTCKLQGVLRSEPKLSYRACLGEEEPYFLVRQQLRCTSCKKKVNSITNKFLESQVQNVQLRWPGVMVRKKYCIDKALRKYNLGNPSRILLTRFTTETFLWNQQYRVGTADTVAQINEKYDSHQRQCLKRYLLHLENEDDLKSSGKHSRLYNNWLIKDKDVIKKQKEESHRKSLLDSEIAKLQLWKTPISLYCTKARKSVVGRLGEKKRKALKEANICSLQDLAILDLEACDASFYLGSTDKRKGGERADIVFRATVQEARTLLVQKFKTKNWEQYLVQLDNKSEEIKELERQKLAPKKAVQNSPVSEPLESHTQAVKTYRLMDFKISASIVDDVCMEIFRCKEPFWKQAFSSTPSTDIWKIDETFKVAKRVSIALPNQPKGSRNVYQPFQSLTTIKNAYGQYLSLHFNFSNGQQDEIRPFLTELLDRTRDKLGDPTFSPKVIVIDNCCTMRQFYKSVFGENIKVHLDIWHWLTRWTDCLVVPVGHPRRAKFFRDMTDAVFVVDLTDFQAAREVIDDVGFENNGLFHYIAKRSKRRPKDSIGMGKAVTAVVDAYVDYDANIRRASEINTLKRVDEKGCETCMKLRGVMSGCATCLWTTTEATFKTTGKNSWTKVFHRQLKHVELGCLSMPGDVCLHSVTSAGHVFSHGSTGHNEAGHRYMMDALGGGIYTPEKLQCFLLRRAFKESQNAALARDKIILPLHQDALVINSLAAPYCGENTQHLPFNMLAPNSKFNYRIGVDVVRDTMPSSRRLKSQVELKQLIERSKEPITSCSTFGESCVQALVQAAALVGKNVAAPLVESAKEILKISTATGTDLLAICAETMRMNLAVVYCLDGTPSLTAQTIVAKILYERQAWVLVEKDGRNLELWALKARSIKLFLQKVKTVTEKKMQKAIEVAKAEFKVSDAGLSIMKRSKVPQLLPVPFVPTNEAEIQLYDERSEEAFPGTSKPTKYQLERFTEKWNLMADTNFREALTGKTFKSFLFPKTVSYIKAQAVQKRQRQLKAASGPNVVGMSEDAQKQVQTLTNILNVAMPAKHGEPPKVPSTFPSLQTNYPSSLPGTVGKLPLATPNMVDAPLSAFAPYKIDVTPKNPAVKPLNWLNRYSFCMMCYQPRKGHHGYTEKGDKKKRVRTCLKPWLGAEPPDLSRFEGTEFDRRVLQVKKPKSVQEHGEILMQTIVKQESWNKLTTAPQTWTQFAETRNVILRAHLCDFYEKGRHSQSLITWIKRFFCRHVQVTMDSSFRQLACVCGVLAAEASIDMFNSTKWWETDRRESPIKQANNSDNIRDNHEYLIGLSVSGELSSEVAADLKENLDANSNLSVGAMLSNTQVAYLIRRRLKKAGRCSHQIKYPGNLDCAKSDIKAHVQAVMKGEKKVGDKIVKVFNVGGFHWSTLTVAILRT